MSSGDDFEDFWTALNQENLTEAQYLERILGPKNLPEKLVLPLTLAYLIIFTTGIFGNLVTCAVIIKNTGMHTPTNYYLFSLAISDLALLTLGLPNEVTTFWQQYPWVLGLVACKTRAYVSEMSSYVSVLTIVAFSVERYIAICHPLRVYSMSAMRRPLRFIVGVWLVALVSAIPFALYTKLNYVEYPPGSGNKSLDSAICAMLLPDMPGFPLYELSAILFFLIPMLLIVVLYARMGSKIRMSARGPTSPADINRNSAHWDSRQIRGRRSVVRMLSTVVFGFFVCWAPFHAQRLLYVYGQEADYYPDLNEWLYIFSGFLYYLGATVNPILYNLMSARYRNAFKKTVGRCGSAGNDSRGGPRRRVTVTSSMETPLFRRFSVDRAKKIFARGESKRDSEPYSIKARHPTPTTSKGPDDSVTVPPSCQTQL